MVGFFIHLSNVVVDFLIIIITFFHSFKIVLHSSYGPLFFCLWQLVLVFIKTICDNYSLAYCKKAKESVWLRFKSVYLVSFIPKLCLVMDLSNIPHHLKQMHEFTDIGFRYIIDVIQRLALSFCIYIPFNAKFLSFIYNMFIFIKTHFKCTTLVVRLQTVYQLPLSSLYCHAIQFLNQSPGSYSFIFHPYVSMVKIFWGFDSVELIIAQYKNLTVFNKIGAGPYFPEGASLRLIGILKRLSLISFTVSGSILPVATYAFHSETPS